jgi:hypothetical protein
VLELIGASKTKAGKAANSQIKNSRTAPDLGQKLILSIRPSVPTSHPVCRLANATAQ